MYKAGGRYRMDKTDNIIQMIGSYTEQIERYENLSTWFAAFSVVCILTVVFFAIALIIRQQKEEKGNRERYHIFLSVLFLIVPSITSLYLYTFAMNMRKVALFRGYLSFLESQYNSLAGSNIMLFDNEIIDTFYSFGSFFVNGFGPIVMAFFVIAALAIGFGASLYFARRVSQMRIRGWLKFAIAILAFVCILFDGLCTYYLSINDQVMHSVVHYCEQQL